jgi:hypothetical protein
MKTFEITEVKVFTYLVEAVNETMAWKTLDKNKDIKPINSRIDFRQYQIMEITKND